MRYDLNVNLYINKEEITKQVLQIKSPGKDGLLLQVHNTPEKGTSKKIRRFIHICFDTKGNLLAASDYTGNIVVIDLDRDKFWVLPALSSCTVLKFSAYNSGELILGVQTGALYIVDTETCNVTGELLCHNYPVMEVAFSLAHICLTASKKEAVVWDLRSNTKIQVLSLLEDCNLKHVTFIPIIGDILACFDDNSMLVWKYGTYEVSQEIQPKSTQSIRSIIFTRNGRAMVLANHLPQLTVFLMDTWTVGATPILPDYITSIRSIAFLPQAFDGGANKMLGVLSGGGVLYFYDMETDEIVSKICTDVEITKFACSVDGKYISCVLHSGEFYIYSGIHCAKIRSSKSSIVQKASKSRISLIRKKTSELTNIQKEMSEYLAVDRLIAILKEFGEYPDSYRSKIWAQLLQLPNNKRHYNNFINHGSSTSFDNLHLDDKLTLRSLQKLLSNMITWCPHFAHVTYLPVFVFPFIKIFHKEPILCFEAVCSIIVNWCQYWFEYFPLPPINVLAIIENIIFEQDVELLDHLTSYDVTSKLYAWPLLEAAFSEVINGTHWCKLWDHILSNEPAFLIACVAAYSLCSRHTLLAMNKKSDFEHFYHNPNTFDLKKFISKAYALMNSISEKNHPRRFLHPFRCLPSGSYPSFSAFPKNMMDFNLKQVEQLKNEQKEIDKETEIMLMHQQMMAKNMEIEERRQIEAERLKEMEAAYRSQILEETKRVKEKRHRVNELRRQLQLEEIQVLHKTSEGMLERNTKQQQQTLEQLLEDAQQNHATEEVELERAEDDLVKRYSELLYHKIKLENSPPTPISSSTLSNDHQLLKIHQQNLAQVLELLKNNNSNCYIKNIALATGLLAMDDLILKIKSELHQTVSDSSITVKKQSAMKVMELESETKQLEHEVSKLLLALAEVKSQETKQKSIEKMGAKVPPSKPSSNTKTQRVKRCNEFTKLKEMIKGVHEPMSRAKAKNQLSLI